MKCAVHTEIDATGYCRNCGKALCPECTRDVRGILYCEECLAAQVAKPQTGAGGANPTLAAVLGFIPGLGAVYNGEYAKALVHILVFVGLIHLADRIDAFGIAVAGFYLYMPFEAYRTAKARAMGRPSTDPFADMARGKPIGAVLLIALGVLLLLENFLPYSFWEHFDRFWPALLIIVGVWLLYRRGQAARGGTQ